MILTFGCRSDPKGLGGPATSDATDTGIETVLATSDTGGASSATPTDTGSPAGSDTWLSGSDTGPTETGVETLSRTSDTGPASPIPTDSGGPAGSDTGRGGSDTGAEPCEEDGLDGRIGGLGHAYDLADALVTGELSGSFFGDAAASSSGALTDDGRRAMVVGAPLNDPHGAAYVIPWGDRLQGSNPVADVSYARIVGDWQNNWGLGEGVAIGELTGDGAEDIVLNDGLSSVVYVVPGPIGRGKVFVEEVATVHIYGARPNFNQIEDRMFTRDVDGDGHTDLLLHEETADHGSGGGMAYLLAGPLEGELDYYHDARTTFSHLAGGWLGKGVDAGDIDGDGMLDVGIGGPVGEEQYYAPPGIHLTRGPVPTGHVELHDAEVQLVGAKSAVEANGDYDGDGTNDLVAGTEGFWPYDDGHVWLVSYPPDGVTELDAVSFARVDGDYAGFFGMAIEAAGDLDGDGCEDLVVQGAYANSFYYGPISGTHLQTEAHRHTMYATDSAIAALGDVDGDGFDDLATGDIIYNGDFYIYKSGAMYIYYGGLGP